MNEPVTTNHLTDDDAESRLVKIQKLTDMGFTEQQARRGLKRTKFVIKIIDLCSNENQFILLRFDFQSAMELLLIQPDIDDDEERKNSISESQSVSVRTEILLFNVHRSI